MYCRPWIAAALASTFILSAVSPAYSQWLKYKAPGIPRTADGKPNLSAPAPRMADGKPDFSGLWRIDSSEGFLTKDGSHLANAATVISADGKTILSEAAFAPDSAPR